MAFNYLSHFYQNKAYSRLLKGWFWLWYLAPIWFMLSSCWVKGGNSATGSISLVTGLERHLGVSITKPSTAPLRQPLLLPHLPPTPTSPGVSLAWSVQQHHRLGLMRCVHVQKQIRKCGKRWLLAHPILSVDTAVSRMSLKNPGNIESLIRLVHIDFSKISRLRLNLWLMSLNSTLGLSWISVLIELRNNQG